MEHDVTDVDTENKQVAAKDLKLAKLETASYDKLVMTTGSWPIIPPIKGIESENILLCKNYNQATKSLLKQKKRRK